MYWLPDNLGYKFLAEAKRLWELESPSKVKLTSIQAAILLHITMGMIGVDSVGQTYTVQAVAMSCDINLFKAEEITRSQKTQRARTLLAWALYDWQVYEAYYNFRVPLIKDPPEMPFPDPMVDPDFHDELWLQYPLSSTTLPAHYGHTIKARSDIRQILADIMCKIRHRPESDGPISFGVVQEFKDRLDTWLQGLPPSMAPRNIVFPAQLECHLEYHSTVIALFQVAGIEANANLVAEMVTKSRIRLETLLRLYYLRHSFSCYTVFILWFVVYIANLSLESSGDRQLPNASVEATRSSLILCANGLKSYGEAYQIANLAYHALSTRMSPNDLQLLRTYTGSEDNAVNAQTLMNHAHSSWPIPIFRFDEDPETARLADLIEQLKDTSLQSEESSVPSTPEST